MLFINLCNSRNSYNCQTSLVLGYISQYSASYKAYNIKYLQLFIDEYVNVCLSVVRCMIFIF